MEIRIYSFEFRLLGVIDDVKSFMRVKRFAAGDSFEITVPLTSKNRFLIQKYRIIDIPGKCSGFVTSFKYAESSGCITFKGSSFDGLLERRILSEGTSADTVMELLDKNAGEKAATCRRFGNTVFDKAVDCPGELTKAQKFCRINEYLENIARNKGFGVYSEIVHEGASPYIRIYGKYGVDRSASQSDVPQVVFSDDYDNITDSSYNYSESGLINSVVCHSDAQLDESKHINIKEFTSYSFPAVFTPEPQSVPMGYRVREEYAEITPSTTYEAHNVDEETVIMWTILDSITTGHTADEQAKATITPAADCFDAGLVMGSDYRSKFDVGDIITIRHKGWGFTSDRRITEITEYIDGVSEKYTAVLGEPIKPLKKLLKG